MCVHVCIDTQTCLRIYVYTHIVPNVAQQLHLFYHVQIMFPLSGK